MMKLFFFLIGMLIMTFFKKILIMSQNFFFMLYFFFILNFNYNYYYWVKIYYFLGMDSLSMVLMSLTVWIVGLSLLGNKMFLMKFNSSKFYMVVLGLVVMLNLTFMSMNMMMFYIFFEGSLIPMVMIIMGWGMQVDRIQASIYMLMYTILGSLPFMIMLMYIYNNYSSLFFNILLLNNLFYYKNLFLYIIMLLGFLIKMPLYFIHIWLPKAHVEAPVSGSMILAGVMLKLGVYGLFRMILMFNFLTLKYSYLLVTLGMVGGIYSSLICLTQVDLKIIVAYSSVVHMNMLLASVLTLGQWGVLGGVMMSIAHGLSSSMLFCLVNVVYERLMSRSLIVNKGLMNLFPSLSMWWFLGCSSNFSVPPSLNFFSEIFLIISLVLFSKVIILLIFLITFFSACYSIYLYKYSQHGVSIIVGSMCSISIREFMILMLHWVPLNMLFIFMLMF